MINARGKPGQHFYHPYYEPYGHKLMGNCRFLSIPGERRSVTNGYVSPGHNSAYYDQDNDRYLLFFHSRFPLTGEMHQVRVHQFFLNADGWPVVAPYRYAGESLEPFSRNDVTGTYKLIDHGHEISSTMHNSVLISLLPDGTVLGEAWGQWDLVGANQIEIILGGTSFRGVFLRQYDENNRQIALTFTAGSQTGRSVWGSMLYIE